MRDDGLFGKRASTDWIFVFRGREAGRVFEMREAQDCNEDAYVGDPLGSTTKLLVLPAQQDSEQSTSSRLQSQTLSRHYPAQASLPFVLHINPAVLPCDQIKTIVGFDGTLQPSKTN